MGTLAYGSPAKRALIFGSFNPVTNAHISMGITAKKALGPDTVVTYIPASDTYIKSWKKYEDGSILSAGARITLLEDAVTSYGFEVSTIETDGVTDGKTYNTVEYFGFDDCVLCLGMDNILQIKKWYNWQNLLARGHFLLFWRNMNRVRQREADSILGQMTHPYTFACLPKGRADISSTQVRDCYRNRDFKKLKSLVPENVFQYLEVNDNVYI